MKTTITILSENYVGKSGLMGEHGFSALIESAKGRFLFDTGPGRSLPYNAEKLHINLKTIDKIFLSHGHYDHTGGLKWAIEQAGPIRVVASKHLFIKHMGMDLTQPSKPPFYAGCPFSQQELEALGAEFLFLNQTTKIGDGVWFLTNYPRTVETVPEDARLVRMENGQIVPDDIPDDSSLLIETDTAPILILGCTHSGIINTLLHLKNDMGISKLKAVIGGTHLMASDESAVERAMDMLDEFSVEMIGTAHCTGFKATVLIATRFKERFVLAAAGSVITV
ncbi:MAG: MBL fold metallo-hydrolase [Desulfobacterales bacterium]|jgi:7,8-dihydropterin-6-yl-methyl-4-(beta-D-ribofuranosyl)aminobenzene 5'-phosphate synthase|nr:MBL fold metallo-hydrolase [Desulfobacterales bacterium]